MSPTFNTSQTMLLSNPKPTVTQQLEKITPEHAASLLKSNKNNRPIKAQKLLALKRDLKNGNFKLTHQGIAIDWNGNLIDGQHRLTAIAESGVAAYMYVTYDCDPEIFKVIDCGSTRNPSDVLKTLGASNYSSVASGARLVLWAHHRYSIYASPFGKATKKAFTASNADISNFYINNKESLERAASHAKQLHRLSPVFLVSALTAFFFLVEERQSDYSEALEFMERVGKGANLEPGSVELAVSKFLSLRYTDLRGYKKGEYMLAVYIKAYNRYIDGDSMLQFRLGSVDPLPFVTEI